MQTYIFFLNHQRLFCFFFDFFAENDFCHVFYLKKGAGIISIRSPYTILWYAPRPVPISIEADSQNP